MARQARLTAQCPPWKATPDVRAALDEEAERRRVDLAQIMREMADQRYGLVDGARVAPDEGAAAG